MMKRLWVRYRVWGLWIVFGEAESEYPDTVGEGGQGGCAHAAGF